MNENSSSSSDRWEELQVARLLFGLMPDEQAEYDELARQRPAEERDQLDMVIASVDVAWSGTSPESLPEHLRRAIRVRAERELGSRPVVSRAYGLSNDRAASPAGKYLPWLVSAACLLFTLFSWMSNRPTTKAIPDLSMQRKELLSANEGHVQANWSAGTTPIGVVTGDVVWSALRQQGFMRFRGLPVNTPTKEQYQLWIFDKNQSDKTPIDGGVFDITTTEEVIVPITAKLHVQDAVMFAVTIEKPGGVVVSSRERLPLLAKVE